jgi:hypothetical protein
MGAVEKDPIYPMWRTALSLLTETKERLDNANDAEKPLLQMEYDDALAAYLAIADEL